MSRPLPNFSSALVLQAPVMDVGEDEGLSVLRALMAVVPESSSLPSGTLVAIGGDVQPARPTRLLDRMIGRTKPRFLHRAVRCTALLAKGYVRVGGGKDDNGIDWAFAWVP
jgi:hypothetical protein